MCASNILTKDSEEKPVREGDAGQGRERSKANVRFQAQRQPRHDPVRSSGVYITSLSWSHLQAKEMVFHTHAQIIGWGWGAGWRGEGRYKLQGTFCSLGVQAKQLHHPKDRNVTGVSHHIKAHGS